MRMSGHWAARRGVGRGWACGERACRGPSEIIGMCTPGAISTVGTAATAATKAACIRPIMATPSSAELVKLQQNIFYFMRILSAIHSPGLMPLFGF